MIEVSGSGPSPARLMIVGEAPGADEEKALTPFVGPSGYLLDKMLAEAGIPRGMGFVTNVCRIRPPNNKIEKWILHRLPKKKPVPEGFVPMRNKFVYAPVEEGYRKLLGEIAQVKPNVIVALGNVALWALTGKWGIQNWRGSELHGDWLDAPKVIPTFHPAAILRQWAWRASAVADLRRAARNLGGKQYERPAWIFEVAPSYSQVLSRLEGLWATLETQSLTLSFDIETRAGHITCAGIAWSRTEAICIPFTKAGSEDGYWMEHEETEVLWRLYKVLTHRNARVIGQNLLYDCQYTARWWGFVPRVAFDTMIAWHTCFAELPKKLDFQASLVCKSYKWWKGAARWGDLKEDA